MNTENIELSGNTEENKIAVAEMAKQIVVDTLQKAVGALTEDKPETILKSDSIIGYVENEVDYIIRSYDLHLKKRVFLAKDFTFCEDALNAVGFKYQKDAEECLNKLKAFYSENYSDHEMLFRTRKCTLNEIGYGE